MSQSVCISLDGLSDTLRLRLRRRNRPAWAGRLAVGFLTREHPVGRFGEMPRDGANGFRMALAADLPFVESAGVAARVAAPDAADDVGRFDERPLEVAIHIKVSAWRAIAWNTG